MGGETPLEDMRERIRNLEHDMAVLKSDVAVNKSEVIHLRTQFDNMRAEHAKLPQSITTIIALILMALSFLVNLYVAGVL